MGKPLPLRVRVFITTAISSLIPLLLAVSILHFSFIDSFEEQIANQAMDIATLAAQRHDVIAGYSSKTPVNDLQIIAEEIRNYTHAAFVVFLDKEGKRHSHPNEALIGLPFTGGDEGPALRGQSYTSKAIGISGPSIRAFAPIFDGSRQIGAVAVGYFEPGISLTLSKIYKIFYIVVPLSLLLILLFSVLLANNIKNLIFGMEPLEIATLLKERDCMLQSVKEGIIAIDQNSEITVVNQVAQNLFPPGTEFVGRHISKLIPDSQLTLVMNTQQPLEDEQLLINGNIVLTNRHPLVINNKVMGAIATFRPLTEVSRIAEELTGVRNIVGALRARTHEFLNKLHVISGLIQLEAYGEAKSYISSITLKEQSLISFLIDNIQCSAIVGLLTGKASEAQEKQIILEIDRESLLITLPEYFDEHAMIVVLGNLIENAFAAVSNQSQRLVRVLIKQSSHDICIRIEDSGTGIPIEYSHRVFEAGFTSKENGQGFGLPNCRNRVDVAGGTITFNTNEKGTIFLVVIPYQLPEHVAQLHAFGI
ncbi:Two-component sensor histidine kinase, malate [Desulfosporosinus sp. I2]|uniref:ATP-binding protein n=1 Tax=Desulfosporosinus sp. I2 TaxID=1617025 RepID=UPI0005EDB0C2|nr:sensor histidine kinase [Desulfosporosinus sp. I2]KJR48354.1 Two-component sensor histidine kinase, malate [Desulfosporosinus sp. I2]